MRRSNLIILVIALAMGGIAAWMAKSWIERHTAPHVAAVTSTVVVASSPLSFGTVLTPDNVQEIAWAGSQLPEGTFASKADLFKDGRRVVLSAMDKTDLVLKTKITGPGQRASLSVLLEEGQRAVTIRVDDVRGVAGFILPGDRVDVVLLRSETRKGETENSADILLQYVKVLAIDQIASEKQDQPAVATVAKAVTLQVSPEQANKILLAGNVGKLSLILRQPMETRSAETGRVTDSDLPGYPRREASAAPVPAAVEKPAPQPASAPAKVMLEQEDVTVTIFHGTEQKKYQVQRQSADSQQAAQ